MPDGNQLTPLEIRVTTPGDPEELRLRSIANDLRAIPEAAPVKTCIIVSSGPSAAHERLWLRLKQDPDLVTVAVNGALKLFTEKGVAPTYWACCDPQDLVLDFLPSQLPRSTGYLIATKCSPKLFDHLQSRNLNVQKWRLDDDFVEPTKNLKCPVAVSITLVVESLMRFKGYHRLEHYGWDACFLDNKHHAVEQPDPAQEHLTFSVNTTNNQTLYTCQTNGSWLAELHDAGLQSHNFTTMGYQLVIHGNGAIANLLSLRGLAEAPDVNRAPFLLYNLCSVLEAKSPACQALSRPIRLAA